MVDTVTLDTPDGKAEARRVGPSEWEIGYPTGDDRFFGTQAEVIALMRRRIAADYPAVPALQGSRAVRPQSLAREQYETAWRVKQSLR